MSDDPKSRAAVALGYVSAAVAAGKVDPEDVLARLSVFMPSRLVARDALELPPDVGEQATLALPGVAPPAPKRIEHDERTIVRIFERWRTACDYPRARLTPERVRHIRARLRDGYTERELCAAIDGIAGSDFHRGENDSRQRYDDLTFVFRNGSNVERFATMGDPGLMAERRSRGSASSTVADTDEADKLNEMILATQGALRAASQKRDRAAYDRHNAELKKLLAQRDRRDAVR